MTDQLMACLISVVIDRDKPTSVDEGRVRLEDAASGLWWLKHGRQQRNCIDRKVAGSRMLSLKITNPLFERRMIGSIRLESPMGLMPDCCQPDSKPVPSARRINPLQNSDHTCTDS